LAEKLLRRDVIESELHGITGVCARLLTRTELSKGPSGQAPPATTRLEPDRRAYAAMITAMDEQIGVVYDIEHVPCGRPRTDVESYRVS
jgi:hypothetical protein